MQCNFLYIRDKLEQEMGGHQKPAAACAQLWVDKYRPKSYIDLLSDEVRIRMLMLFLEYQC